MRTTALRTDRPTAVLPLRGLWRAGLLAAWDFQALDRAGIRDLGELSRWSRRDLLGLPGVDHAAATRLEALLARYCLCLTPARRARSRRRGL